MALPLFTSLLLQLILLPAVCTIAQQISPIKVGTTLTTNNSSWHSPSGDFAFGFTQIDDTNYLLSIWYAKIPDTIVWYAGADGILAPKGSSVTCTADKGIVLKDPQGNNLFNLTFTGIASSCFLNDTGSLLIKGTEGDTLWQSFDDPRDTLLPSQTMGNLQSGGGKVYSKHSNTNFTRGKFQLRLLDDGDLVLNTRNLLTDFAYDGAYYSSDTSDPNNASNSGFTVSYDISGHMYILKQDGALALDLLAGKAIPSPKEDFYFRATLNFDGVLVWYYHKKQTTNGTSSWSVIDWQSKNICSDKTGTMDGGVCGYNSICKMVYSGDYSRPTCECPPNYSLVDPNDTFGSCEPDFRLGYNLEVDYRLEKLPMTDWPQRDYDMINPMSEDECQKSCLNDFQCVAVILNDETCWKKGLPLINGRIDETRTAFLKMSDANHDDIPIPIVIKHWKGVKPLISTFVGASVFINLLLFSIVLGCWFFRRRKHRVPHRVKNTIGTWKSTSSFTYKEIEEATNGFKDELGRGACAIVYKGIIYGPQLLVAVKKIDRAVLREADKEFKTEVSVIGKTHHRNLVRLIGFCEEDEHRMLVYEFMSNGSLAEFLFGETRPNWFERVRIAQGVARGILYLHEECENQIIHCDIKPQNILLDDYFEARISDFGLSKLLNLNQSQTHTAVRGTKGYVAPEWFRNKPVTVKVDVYSFGVVLLEILSCRRCIDMESVEEEHVVLIDWALDCYQSGDVSALVEDDMEALDDYKRVLKFVEVVIWCIQDDPKLRPTMRQVTLMLEGVIDVPTPPDLDRDSSLSFNIVTNH